MNSFVYLHSTDVAEARRFYSELVGLTEIYYSDTEPSVGYLHGSLQLTVTAHSDAATVAGWARQLGWDGGADAAPSWGFELEADAFVLAVEAITAAEIPTWATEPSWVGYWSFPVRDPMGNTVELTTPDRGAWPPSPSVST